MPAELLQIPKGPFWLMCPVGETVTTSITLSHCTPQLMIGNEEILYFLTQVSQQIQMGGMKFELEHLAKPTKLLCAVGEHFTLESFTHTVMHHVTTPASLMAHRPRIYDDGPIVLEWS